MRGANAYHDIVKCLVPQRRKVFRFTSGLSMCSLHALPMPAWTINCSVFWSCTCINLTHHTESREHICWFFFFICFSFTTCTGPKSFSVLLRAVWWRITHNVLPQSSSWSTHLSEISPTRGKCAFSSKTTLTAPRRRGERRVCIFCCLTVKLSKWIVLQE